MGVQATALALPKIGEELGNLFDVDVPDIPTQKLLPEERSAKILDGGTLARQRRRLLKQKLNSSSIRRAVNPLNLGRTSGLSIPTSD